jgi:molybdopterin-guanine dinucleotide biosynthesis protein A
MNATGRLTGIILAGGQSSRMGCDKASLPWGKGDLLHAVLTALAPVCQSLIVVSNVPRTISLAGVSVLTDKYRGCGPLGGMHAGLAASTSDYNFVVACDMPYINGDAVAYLAAAAAGYDAAVPYIDGYYHPLHAVYHRRCLASIERLLARGIYRVIDFYPEIKLKPVAAAELARFAPDLAMLRNINTPGDLDCN